MSAPDFCIATRRKARKPHRCCECNEDILPGSEYIIISGFWDGRPDSWKQCLRCDAVSSSIVKRLDQRGCLGDGIMFTRLYEDVYEALRDDWSWPAPWEMPDFLKRWLG